MIPSRVFFFKSVKNILKFSRLSFSFYLICGSLGAAASEELDPERKDGSGSVNNKFKYIFLALCIGVEYQSAD